MHYGLTLFVLSNRRVEFSFYLIFFEKRWPVSFCKLTLESFSRRVELNICFILRNEWWILTKTEYTWRIRPVLLLLYYITKYPNTCSLYMYEYVYFVFFYSFDVKMHRIIELNGFFILIIILTRFLFYVNSDRLDRPPENLAPRK